MALDDSWQLEVLTVCVAPFALVGVNRPWSIRNVGVLADHSGQHSLSMSKDVVLIEHVH